MRRSGKIVPFIYLAVLCAAAVSSLLNHLEATLVPETPPAQEESIAAPVVQNVPAYVGNPFEEVNSGVPYFSTDDNISGKRIGII